MRADSPRRRQWVWAHQRLGARQRMNVTMNVTERSGLSRGDKSAPPRRLIRWVVGGALILLLSCPAFAQYGGGGTGSGSGSGTGTGTSMGSPTYKYGSGKAIGIGVGAAVGGAGVLYLALHHRHTLTACVESGDDGLRLADEKHKTTYTLVAAGTDLKPGERVELQGKKSTAAGGGESFQANKLLKNLGTCGAPSMPTSTASAASPSSK
jgi:hypothetical protein